MLRIIQTLFIFTSLCSGPTLACNGVFDPQTGICHQSNGYQIPGQLKDKSLPKDYWGAIAIDAVNGETSGSSINRTSKNDAENAALKVCNDTKNCQISVSYKNSCGAVATNGKGIRIGATNPNPAIAEQKALASCNKQSNSACRIWIPATCAGVGY